MTDKERIEELEKEKEEIMGSVVGLVRSRELILLEKISQFIDENIEIENDMSALMLIDFFNKEMDNIKSHETFTSFHQSQNTKAVEALEKVKAHILEDVNYKDELERKGHLTDYGKGGASRNIIIIHKIDKLIKEYGGER